METGPMQSNRQLASFLALEGFRNRITRRYFKRLAHKRLRRQGKAQCRA
jgi:hypothetical protein